MKIQSAEILFYILGGKAIFTVHNPLTGNRFTYKVVKVKDATVYFVKTLTGRDNENSYEYIGFIKNTQFIYGRGKSRIRDNAPSVMAFNWLLKNVNNLGPVEVLASGKCCRCGRTLTTPESVISGWGPECIKMRLAS